MLCLLLITIVLVSTLGGNVSSQTLPGNIRPTHYRVVLDPTLDQDPAPFEGSVVIHFEVIENTDKIILHANKLNITADNITVIRADQHHENIVGSSYGNHSFFTVQMEKELQIGENYTLIIAHFHGHVEEKGYGFFLGKYKDRQGNERRYLATHFQTTGARNAFPCFDEARFKAKFIVHLKRKQNYIALSNEHKFLTMKLENGKYVDIFVETEKISTYVLAFLISEFAHTETVGKQTIYSDQATIDSGDAYYALEFTNRVYNEFESFIGIRSNISKIDHVALPGTNYSAGAVENWGLPIYDKQFVVYPMATATSADIEFTNRILSHEIIHYWIGNLVTCSSWKHFWLNEGFVTYFEYQAISLVKPKWRFTDRFITNVLHVMLAADSLNNTIALNNETNPGLLPSNMLPSYYKGAALLRMMEHVLTFPVFMHAIKKYVLDNAYKTVEPRDFYAALQATSDSETNNNLQGLSIESILETWITQPGYPLVTFTKDYTNGAISATQERFCLNDTNKYDHLWYIPLRMFSEPFYGHSTEPSFWMTKRNMTLSQHHVYDGWFLFNVKQTGYFRVNYDERNWNLLIEQLKRGPLYKIPLINRAQLIDDSLNLAKAGKLPYHIALNLTTYLTNEVDYLPLTALFNNLEFLNTMMASTKNYPKFKNYVRTILRKAYFNLENIEPPRSRDHLRKIVRSDVIKWMCNMELVHCRNNSRAQLRTWMRDSSKAIAPNLEEAILCGAIRAANQSTCDFVYGRYVSRDHSPTRLRLLKALGCSEDIDILKRLFDKIVSPTSTLLPDDASILMTAVYSSGTVGLAATLDYIDNNFETMKNQISIPKVLNDICNKLTTVEQLNAMVALATKHGIIDEVMHSGIATIKSSELWSRRVSVAVERWLIDKHF